MRYRVSAAVLIGLSVLCLTGCGTTRKVSEVSSSRVQVSESNVVATTDEADFTEVRDTLREVTTITIDRNDRGDTLRLTTETDRYRGHDANRFRTQESRVMVRHDTVYIEKRDSVYVSNTNFTNGTNNQGGKTALHTTLKWIFWIIIGLIGLAITVKVCLLKR